MLNVGVVVGSKVLEIELVNLKGKMIKLFFLYGKVVFVDFWVFWCGLCRKENLYVVEVYYKYYIMKFCSGKGFEVFFVLFDCEEIVWIKVIEIDKFVWLNYVWDKNNEVGKVYNV